MNQYTMVCNHPQCTGNHDRGTPRATWCPRTADMKRASNIAYRKSKNGIVRIRAANQRYRKTARGKAVSLASVQRYQTTARGFLTMARSNASKRGNR